MEREAGPRWLVNRCLRLGEGHARTLATPGLLDPADDACHVHNVYRAVFGVEGHDAEVYAAMQDLFDWHNLRVTGFADEAFFRCLAIYGAAAHAVLVAAPSPEAGE